MPTSVDSIEKVLREFIPVSHLEIIDQSSGCGENYAVLIVSEAFNGKTTLTRHRFGEHALINVSWPWSIPGLTKSKKTLTPEQYEKQLAKEAAA
ncbi:hypothetical protein EW145_g1613 [Phellinidium pouzarii]|uniref:Uncharacterized protein n=1 Tax=Phellinidium pouzarii TaxID=167371 RepID=A0A4S4LFL3_9AGAM|nr:hypothetical protein EW145_g1613 [Phellinidium pouzarii]